MKTMTTVLCLFFLAAAAPGAQKIAVLPELNRPGMFAIAGDDLYVAEGAEVLLYSLKERKLIRKFGKKGEGPGEFNILTPLQVQAYPDYVLVASYGKISRFGRDGKLLQEIKHPPFISNLTPLGKNFLGTQLQPGDSARKESRGYIAFSIFDGQVNKVAELSRQDFQMSMQGGKLSLLPSIANAVVAGGQIYILEGQKGLVVAIFSAAGKRKSEITLPYEKIRVSEGFKKEAIEKFKNNPQIKPYWDMISKMYQFEFPEFFPPLKNMAGDGQRLYLHTYRKEKNKDQFIILGQDGKVQKTLYLTVPEPQVLGEYYKYAFVSGSYYYLLENEADETWELFCEKIF